MKALSLKLNPKDSSSGKLCFPKKNASLDAVSRREHGCDCCHRNNFYFKDDADGKRKMVKDGKPTQMFLGYCGEVLWICHKCYEKMSAGIPRYHRNRKIFIKKIYDKRRGEK